MRATFQPDGQTVIEVDARVATCIVPACNGVVVRHSLGGGQAVDRCSRCFRRYQLRPNVETPSTQSRLRRLLTEFVTWQDDE